MLQHVNYIHSNVGLRLDHLDSASFYAFIQAKLHLDYFRKPSDGQGPAFNYIESILKN